MAFEWKRLVSKTSALSIVLTGLLVGFGTLVFAQSDYDEKIEELEKALEEIKASIREGQDVGARIEALEAELAKLKEDIAAGEPSEEESEEQVAAAETEDQLPPAGVQGAPNPMQDDKKYLPGDAIRRAGSFHLNLIWFPYKLASTGFEIMWGERVNKDGARGEAWRLQYMAKDKFN